MTRDIQMTSQMRDAQAAEEAGRLAEQGYFDTTLTVYGCAYLENGTYRDKVSTKAEDIYRFIEAGNLRDLFPSNVQSLSKTSAVPMGVEQEIEEKMKQALSAKLRSTFPDAFLERLQEVAAWAQSDRARDDLWKYAETLEGHFDKDALDFFEGCMNHLYTCRKLKPETFSALCAWLENERKDMKRNDEDKDLFERTVYGYLYLDDERVQYVDDACLSYICKHLYRLEAAGGVATQVFEKTFWYNYSYRLADVMRDFKALLRTIFDRSYLEQLETLRRDREKEKDFAKLQRDVQAAYGVDCAETFLRYGGRWGLYRD